jgi:hypothetical protein
MKILSNLALLLLVVGGSFVTSSSDRVVFDDTNRFLEDGGATEVTTEVEQLGQSGKFRIYDGSKGNNDTNAVTVEVDSVMELAGDDERIVGGHGTQTMANQEFTISGPEDATINGVSASMISFTSTLATKGGNPMEYGTIAIDVYIINEGGSVGTDSEEWAVATNDVKFNIVLSNWTFCDGCSYGGGGNGGNGGGNGGAGGQPDSNIPGGGNPNTRKLQGVDSTHVDVSVIIKGKDDSPSENEDGDYDLGGGVSMMLSDVVATEEGEKEMADGYPMVKQTGGKTVYTFRFPRFEEEATYDPVVEFSTAGSEDDGGEDGSGDGGASTVLSSALLLLVGSLCVTLLDSMF